MMRRAGTISCLLGGALLIAACGPMTLADAELSCIGTARDALGPRGEADIGVATDGDRVLPVARFEVSVSSDYIAGRDPAMVYDNCVRRRSGGQAPSRPLYDQPGWTGRRW